MTTDNTNNNEPLFNLSEYPELNHCASKLMQRFGFSTDGLTFKRLLTRLETENMSNLELRKYCAELLLAVYTQQAEMKDYFQQQGQEIMNRWGTTND